MTDRKEWRQQVHSLLPREPDAVVVLSHCAGDLVAAAGDDGALECPGCDLVIRVRVEIAGMR